MKKIGFLFVIIIIALSGLAMAQEESTRYYIKSTDVSLNAKYGIHHNFKHGFTTELTKGQVQALENLGIEIEEVPIYHLFAKPYCGDGQCRKGETEETCPADCAPPQRTCEPTNQIPPGIQKVNGGYGGAGITVAVLDSGVYKDHLDLRNNIIDCKDTTDTEVKKGCLDIDGHGTHVAGTIAADGGSDGLGIYGVAPGANLMAIRVCSNDLLGVVCWADDVALGINYAADNRANIVSMSLGGSVPSTLIEEAVDYAVSKGVLLIAAAGNDGPDADSIGYPAAYKEVIAVGAIYHSDYTDTINWYSCTDTAPGEEDIVCFSSRGINNGDYIITEREVEFAAPGAFIESTYDDGCYRIWAGTSMATPHISGLAAKLWQGDAISTRDYLHSIANDIWDAGDDTATGIGLPIAP